ncbi:MAG TPA: VOC family protein [Candidatus Paceibacterota bacterium]|nr:VOC family protein [Candidatus Paceibacterota bacterium]
MKIIPYLRFNDDKCREAFDFYKNCFGGEITFQTVGESQMPEEYKTAPDKIMHATLKSGELAIYGSDMMRDKAVIGDQIALTYEPNNEDDAKAIFAKLSEGGEVFQPLEKQFWGALFGMVTDKYGIEWMINYQLPE